MTRPGAAPYCNGFRSPLVSGAGRERCLQKTRHESGLCPAHRVGGQGAGRRLKAEAWDSAIEEAFACGWLNDYARDEMFARNPYRDTEVSSG